MCVYAMLCNVSVASLDLNIFQGLVDLLEFQEYIAAVALKRDQMHVSAKVSCVYPCQWQSKPANRDWENRETCQNIQMEDLGESDHSERSDCQKQQAMKGVCFTQSQDQRSVLPILPALPVGSRP